MFRLIVRVLVSAIVLVSLAIILRGPPVEGAEVCVYAASGYLATGTQNCVKDSAHSQNQEGYTTINCTGQQAVIFDSYIPTGPGKTFTATAYMYSDDTDAGERCVATVGLLSMVGHCLSASPTTNDGTVCQTDADCTGGRTCRGGVLDNALISDASDLTPIWATRTFAAATRYATAASSAADIQRWGDDGASAFVARNLDCGLGSCTGHTAKLIAYLNSNQNGTCTASLSPYNCCTGSGTGTCNTTASNCAWYAICIETP